MGPEEIRSKLELHEYRMENFERLADDHNKELKALRAGQAELNTTIIAVKTQIGADLSRLTNRIILALIGLQVLGSDGVSILTLLKFIGN